MRRVGVSVGDVARAVARREQLFADAGIKPTLSFRVEQLSTACALAETNMGCTFLTDTLFRFHRREDNLVLYHIAGENLHRTLYVVHRKKRYRNIAMEEFMAAAREIFEKS
jgi:DNA-binding transcriptional LysR family regulator